MHKLLVDVRNKLLQSHLFFLFLARRTCYLEFVYALYVLVDLVVGVFASDDFGGLEQQPEVAQVEVDHHEYDDGVVYPHAVESVSVCGKTEVCGHVKVDMKITYGRIRVHQFLVTKVNWHVKEKVVFVRINGLRSV